MNFQKVHGLDVDGIVGSQTEEALYGADAASSTVPSLQAGDSGTEVEILQKKLIELGYNLGSYGADGQFGPATLDAVVQFQQAKGLDTDGIVGSKTQTKLLEVRYVARERKQQYAMEEESIAENSSDIDDKINESQGSANKGCSSKYINDTNEANPTAVVGVAAGSTVAVESAGSDALLKLAEISAGTLEVARITSPWAIGAAIVFHAEPVGQTQEAEDKAIESYNLREKGEPYPNHKVDDSGKDLPAKGEPNSSVDKLNPDGSVKQRRYYGSDGRAQEDIDHNHTDDGTHTFPHRHEWDWSQKNPRLDSR